MIVLWIVILGLIIYRGRVGRVRIVSLVQTVCLVGRGGAIAIYRWSALPRFLLDSLAQGVVGDVGLTKKLFTMICIPPIVSVVYRGGFCEGFCLLESLFHRCILLRQTAQLISLE